MYEIRSAIFTPQFIQDLTNDHLQRALIEYRQAHAMLTHNRETSTAAIMESVFTRAITAMEEELFRRGNSW